MIINKSIKTNKKAVIKYFRERSSEFIEEVNRLYSNRDFSKKASKLNSKLKNSKEQLLQTLLQKALKEKWSNDDILKSVLNITYSNYVVMLETRHSFRPYEYMDFSRRIGELWEPFCKICFNHPLTDLELFVPPLFTDVKKKLYIEIEDYIKSLKISKVDKDSLINYYNKVWNLVTSGEIQLELDLHFIQNNNKYVLDFKSGFGSNEKGNVNRLLLVASIYHTIEENYVPLLFVRSSENNHYFDTLKNSDVWKAFCGAETYEQIKKYTGFDIHKWIIENISWESDLDKDFSKYLIDNNLFQYLKWE